MKKLYLAFFLFVFTAASAFPQSTGFMYQGSLNNSGLPANGNYDFEFKLFNAATGGTTTAPNQQAFNVTVTNGIFATVIDFSGFAFPGEDRFLEISVRPAGGGGFTTLTPRQKVNVTPQSIKSIFADSASNANNAQFATNASQLGGIAANQFVLTNDARLSDARNPLPNSANYIQNRTSPQASTNFNISGNGTAGGTLTGNIVSATTQYNIGANRFLSNGGDTRNVFAGVNAGSSNTTGFSNSYVGSSAGSGSTTGQFNAFFGNSSGNTNVTGSKNTILGTFADVGSGSLDNATAIGYQAVVETSNSLVLGGVLGRNGAQSDTSVGIGTTTPDAPLDVASQLAGSQIFRLTNFGGKTVFRTRSAPGTRTNPTATQLNDILFEMQADGHTGSAFTAQGRARILVRATQNWNSTGNGTAIDFYTTPNNSTGPLQRMVITNDGLVGIGRSDVDAELDVNGDIRVGLSGTPIGCVEDRNGTVIAGICSSDLRFKKNVTPFGSVLNNFSQLRPVNYYWRVDEFTDKHFGKNQSYGLIAQDVEQLFPDLVSTDEKGYRAVNYSKLPLLTIQAVKELKQENDELKRQIDALRRVVCQSSTTAEICRESGKENER